MDSDDDICTPPDILELATKETHNLLPEKSRKLYEKEYNNFLAWKIEKKTTSFSENDILLYLKDLSDKFKPSSMWAKYSMLKSTLSIYNNIDITKYSKVIAFLKRSSEGHKEKKSLTFTSGQIKMFLEESPDILYLFEKVALIFGIMGACRRQELYNIQFDEVSNIDDSTIMVKVSKTKTKIDRSFVVTGKCYAVCKKYLELRPTHCRNPAFFLSYKSGKCVDQRTGINKFGALGKTIASFLNLPNPALYTGHCFRRTSATLLIDSGGDLTALKRHGGRKSSTVAKSSIDESLMNKIQVSNTILNSIENKTNDVIINIPTPSTSSTACPATATAAGSIINIMDSEDPVLTTSARPIPYDPSQQSGDEVRIGALQLWEALTEALSNGGVQKCETEAQWRKVWADLKVTTLRKVKMLRQNDANQLTDFDQRILKIIEKEIITKELDQTSNHPLSETDDNFYTIKIEPDDNNDDDDSSDGPSTSLNQTENTNNPITNPLATSKCKTFINVQDELFEAKPELHDSDDEPLVKKHKPTKETSEILVKSEMEENDTIGTNGNQMVHRTTIHDDGNRGNINRGKINDDGHRDKINDDRKKSWLWIESRLA